MRVSLTVTTFFTAMILAASFPSIADAQGIGAQGRGQGAINGQGIGVGRTPPGVGTANIGVGAQGRGQGTINGRGIGVGRTPPGAGAANVGVGAQGNGQGRINGRGVGVGACATPPCK